VIVAHIMGLPIEESVLQLAPAGVASITALAVAGQLTVRRLRRRLRRAAEPADADPEGIT